MQLRHVQQLHMRNGRARVSWCDNMEALASRIKRVLADLAYIPRSSDGSLVLRGWPFYGDVDEAQFGVLHGSVLVAGNRQHASAVAVRSSFAENLRIRQAEQAEAARRACLAARRREQRAAQPAAAKLAAAAERREKHAALPLAAKQKASAKREEQRATQPAAAKLAAAADRREKHAALPVAAKQRASAQRQERRAAQPEHVKQAAAAKRRRQNAARRAAAAAQVDVQQQVQVAECARVDPLLTEPTMDPKAWKAPRPDLASDVKDAFVFSKYLEEHLPVHVCAVCGVYHGAADLERKGTQDLPMSLLRRDGPKSEELPRSGLTLCRIGGVDYCLAHEGVLDAAPSAFVLLEPAQNLVRAAVFDQQHVSMHVCKEHCLPALLRNKVPKHSFVVFDAGRWPDVPDLQPLSLVEELVVAPLRANRFTAIAHAGGQPENGRTRDTYQSYLQGHVLAVPNVPLTTLDKLVTPLHPDALGEMVSVVLLSHAQSAEQADDIAKRVRCVQIRPKVVVAWVKWLQVVYASNFPDLNLHTDTSALSYYENQHDIFVPVSIREQTRFVADERMAEAASTRAAGVRAGYANVSGDDEHALAAKIASLSLDFGDDAPSVVEQLSHDDLDGILRLWPCALQLPAMPNPAAPDVLLQASCVCIASMGGEGGFVDAVMHVPATEVQHVYCQLDAHVKRSVKQHQMTLGTVSEHMAGVEDVSVVVDLDSVVHAQLPHALRTLCGEVDADDGDVRQDATAPCAAPNMHVGQAAPQGSLVDDAMHEDVAAQGDAEASCAEATLLNKVRRVFLGEDTVGRVGLVTADSTPFADVDKRWPALTHPGMFPYGTGTPPKGMSYDAWLPVILQRAPRQQFAQQPMFVLDMYNITQRHQVNRAARHVLQANSALFEEFSRMTHDELVMAARLFMNKQRGKPYSEAFTAAPMVVQRFVSTLRQIGGKVRGSPAYYASCRSQAFAPWHAFGPFTCFPTYNPSELHNASALRVLGFDVEYDDSWEGMGVPTNLPNMVDRWRAVAANPVACAQQYQVFRNAIWNVYYGWPRGKTGQHQAVQDCRFGRIRAIVDRVEHSSRGGLHSHMLLAQTDMQPVRLRQLQADADALKELQVFCEQLSCKQMPDGWHVARSHGQGQPAEDFKKVTGHKVLGACYKFPIGRAHDVVGGGDMGVGVEWPAVRKYVQEFQARLVGANQVHAHTHRCEKGGGQKNDLQCAMFKPEATRQTLEVLPGGCMLLRCDHGMLTPYCPAMMLVDPCNHAIVLCFDASRWETQRTRAEALGQPFDVELPSLELHAAQAANYALKYITKRAQEVENAAELLVAGCSSCRVVDMRDNVAQQQVDVGRRRIVQLLNKMHGKLVVPQSLAALHLCRFPDFYMTHKVAPYYPSSFAAHFRRQLAPHLEVHFVAGKEMASAVYNEGRMSFVKQVHDYVYRPDALAQFPAYMYLMSFEKVAMSRVLVPDPSVDDGVGVGDAPRTTTRTVEALGRGRYQFDFVAVHPQAHSHTIVRRSELHLPQAISNYPVQPADDAAQLEKELYALSILSMFMSDRLLVPLCALGYGLWDIFVGWRDCAGDDARFDLLLLPGFSVHDVVAGCQDMLLHAGVAACSAAEHHSINDVAAVPAHAAADGACSAAEHQPVGGVGNGFAVLGQCERLPPLLDALRVLAACKPANASVPNLYEHWHVHGRTIVKNIQSLAAAQAEDRRRAALLHRAHVRRATQMRPAADAAEDSETDDGEDECEDVHWEDDAFQLFANDEPPPDPNDCMMALLDVLSDRARSDAAEYAATAFSKLPPVQFAALDQQQRLSPAVAEAGYIAKDEVDNVMSGAGMAQRGEHAAAAAATMDGGCVWYEMRGVGRVLVKDMQLHNVGTPSVCAHVQYVCDDGDMQSMRLVASEHGPPPDFKLHNKPGIVDTIRLFTLSKEQAFAFVQLADALLLEREGRPMAEPLRMVLTGEPGTGKSQVLKAFEWFALQWDASHLLLVASFTWRAALMVSTAKHPARSTCSAFAINPILNTVGDSSEALSGVRFVFLDEYSFINCRHMCHISESVRKAAGLAETEGRCFAGLNVILCGDLCQHKPVKGAPLFADSEERKAYNELLNRIGAKQGFLSTFELSGDDTTGQNAYRTFDRVVFLTQQQRISAEGVMLYKYSRMFMAEDRPSREDVAEFCDALNAKVVTPQLMQQLAAAGRVPRVVCLRNDLRMQLNWTLACLHALALKVRPIVWFARDLVSPGQGRRPPVDPTTTATNLPRVVRDALAFMKPEDTEGVGSMQIFFPGCIYTFNDNAVPLLGVVNNAECVGVDLLVSPGEVDDGKHGCWFLKRPPVAVFVRPVNTSVSHSAWQAMKGTFPSLPEGCVPVTPQWTDSFKVKYYVKQRPAEGGPEQEVAHTMNVRRFGIHLSDAYAVTDYYCQGVSFKLDAWLAHLNAPPTGGGLQRPAVFVVLTRWGAWEHVTLLCPLWAEGDTAGRDRVIDQFHQLACLEPDLRKELQRLKHASEAAKGKFAHQWERAIAAAVR